MSRPRPRGGRPRRLRRPASVADVGPGGGAGGAPLHGQRAACSPRPWARVWAARAAWARAASARETAVAIAWRCWSTARSSVSRSERSRVRRPVSAGSADAASSACCSRVRACASSALTRAGLAVPEERGQLGGARFLGGPRRGEPGLQRAARRHGRGRCRLGGLDVLGRHRGALLGRAGVLTGAAHGAGVAVDEPAGELTGHAVQPCQAQGQRRRLGPGCGRRAVAQRRRPGGPRARARGPARRAAWRRGPARSPRPGAPPRPRPGAWATVCSSSAASSSPASCACRLERGGHAVLELRRRCGVRAASASWAVTVDAQEPSSSSGPCRASSRSSSRDTSPGASRSACVAGGSRSAASRRRAATVASAWVRSSSACSRAARWPPTARARSAAATCPAASS